MQEEVKLQTWKNVCEHQISEGDATASVKLVRHIINVKKVGRILVAIFIVLQSPKEIKKVVRPTERK